MKVLVIGGAGFVAGHLLEALKSEGFETHATLLPGERLAADGTAAHELDVRDAEGAKKLLAELEPERIYYLAAISSVAVSWQNPRLTADVNIMGALNIMEALKSLKSSARVLFIGSSEEYGFSGRYHSVLDEAVLPKPGNVYAVTKCAQNMLASVYAKAYGLNLIIARAFNHIGAGQAPQFVTADFARQIARMEAGLEEPVLRVGNLDAERDFCDVRDIVRAYMSLIELGLPGEIYNVGSGRAVAIREVVRELTDMASVKITVEIAPEKLRPLDIPSTRADIGRLVSLCGWQPRFTLRESLAEVLNFWRGCVASEVRERS